MRFKWGVFASIIFGLIGIGLSFAAGDRVKPAPEASGLPPNTDGKGVSVDVYEKEPPAEPKAVRPVAPHGDEGSSSRLSPANQSQAGVGFQLRFGEGDKNSNAKKKERRERHRESGEKHEQKIYRER